MPTLPETDLTNVSSPRAPRLGPGAIALVCILTGLVLLAAVAAAEGVHVPWAVESGSRAWGFPSPDSDYDCRFLYVRPVARYLDPWPPRDVVETPLDAVLDVGGWDVLKSKRLSSIAADANGDKKITLNELYNYTRSRVSALGYGGRQSTQVYPTGSSQVLFGR